jgi:hypothetical protein
MPSRPDPTPSPPPAPADRPLVDVTLIDEMLALTPTERLQQNDRTLDMLDELRRGLESNHPPR